jgi:hypothetical protein
MNFFAYIPNEEGDEPLGTYHNRHILPEFKTVRGAINYLNRKVGWNDKPYVLKSFEDYWDKTTFKTVYTNTHYATQKT